jgi:hypothetical protein
MAWRRLCDDEARAVAVLANKRLTWLLCPSARCLVGSGVVTDGSAVGCCQRALPSPVALRTVGSRIYHRVGGSPHSGNTG